MLVLIMLILLVMELLILILFNMSETTIIIEGKQNKPDSSYLFFLSWIKVIQFSLISRP
jgi:hypothetical protein